MNKKKTGKVLFYDIETTPLQAWVWKLGKTVLRHDQLVSNRNRYDIICMAYCWDDGKPAQVIGWDFEEQNSSVIIETFDSLLSQAETVIGKNSNRFDNKHMNTLRMYFEKSGRPDWIRYTDDLEKQMRKYFYLPSYSLDYFSQQLGFGGKVKMELSDWIHICEQTPKEGIKRYNKMLKYCKKDIEDTRAIWDYCSKHFETRIRDTKHVKFDRKDSWPAEIVCKTCGSTNLTFNGTRTSGESVYDTFRCNDHHGYGGRYPVKFVKSTGLKRLR